MRHALAASVLVALSLASASAGATPCAAPSECPSGFCVSGVCCDRTCDGPCEACTAAKKGAGEDGTCGNVAAGTVQCRAGSCVDGKETAAATCDAAGACPVAVTTECGAYVCDGSKCRTSCRSPLDCTSGFVCDEIEKKCVNANTCDGDHTIVALNGAKKDCTPFKCDKDRCLDKCVATSQCVPGYVCNGAECVVPAAAPDEGDDGGCAVGRGGSPSVWLLLGLAAAGRLLRRR
ncbi:MAG: hypothetical protein HYV09_33065 [Deltaproteobacteria bacterium]|nr:hypothetical protein [Deltaproteobacteria bacterium]